MKFLYELKLKGWDSPVSDEFNPGVMVKQIVTFPDATEDDLSSVMFVKGLLDMEQEFIEEYIEVVVTQLPEPSSGEKLKEVEDDKSK